MIDIFIDLDDTIFDFSRNFNKFLNSLLPERKFEIPKEVTGWGEEIIFNLSRKEMDYFLDMYGEKGKVEIQPILPGACELISFVNNHSGLFNPHFITIRPADVFIQTLRSINELYKKCEIIYPTANYHLHQIPKINGYLQGKVSLINELNTNVGKAIFIDDNPNFINDVVERCPNVVAIQINNLNLDPELCEPHYRVTHLSQIVDLLGYRIDFENLLSNSKHPYSQQNLCSGN